MITKAAVRAYRSELRISGDRYTLNWVEKFMHRNDMEGGPNLKVSKSFVLAGVLLKRLRRWWCIVWPLLALPASWAQRLSAVAVASPADYPRPPLTRPP